MPKFRKKPERLLREKVASQNEVTRLQAERDELSELESLREKNAELEHIFELQRVRERPWIERWRRETGKELSLPDYGAMLEWIMTKAETAEAQLAELKGEI